MILIEKTYVTGLEPAIRGMRNPMNSWARSDSQYALKADEYIFDTGFSVGANDLDLMKRLAKGGATHAKYRRMIVVYLDITAPIYWWKEFDTYKVGTVANSCSTMHKIADKEFTLDDFSHEHLTDYWHDGEYCRNWLETLECLVDDLNVARRLYLETKDKTYWWQMIQLLPSSYNQKRTVMLNYEVLSAIYRDRRAHKLDEWRAFCAWIERLPYAEVIIGAECV